MAVYSFRLRNPKTDVVSTVTNMDGETSLTILKSQYKFLNSTVQMIDEKGVEVTIYHDMPMDDDMKNDSDNPFSKNYVHTELDVNDVNYYRDAIIRLAFLKDYENYNE